MLDSDDILIFRVYWIVYFTLIRVLVVSLLDVFAISIFQVNIKVN